MLTGSHHFQLYWYSFDEVDTSLRMLGAVYIIDTDEWMSRDSVFLKPPHIPLAGVNGLWNGTCILCHTTRGVPGLEPGKGFDSEATEFGIACESCHGPGEKHVQTHRLPTSRYAKHWSDEPDPTIVNPRHLEPHRQALICGQCHGQFVDADYTEAHTHHRPDSAASDCVNCHMPHTTWGQQRAIRSHAITSPNVTTSLATGRPDACSLCHVDKTYDWTAGHLKDWYDHEIPAMAKEERQVAVGPLLAIRGDAGQRALMAWALGWPEAQATANTWWMHLTCHCSCATRTPSSATALTCRWRRSRGTTRSITVPTAARRRSWSSYNE